MLPSSGPFLWAKVKKKNCYALTDANGTEIASMSFGKWSYMNATIQIGDASYSIAQPKWWKSYTIISDGEGKEIGKYTMHWNGKGTLELQGKTYTWTWNNWWATKWKWVGAHQRDVMLFDVQGMWQQTCKIEIVGNAEHQEHALMAIGWYVIHVSMMNAASSM